VTIRRNQNISFAKNVTLTLTFFTAILDKHDWL